MGKVKFNPLLHVLLLISVLGISSCAEQTSVSQPPTRLETIPSEAVKMTSDEDAWPPVSAPGWSQPVPLDGPVNTAGGEDSPPPPLSPTLFHPADVSHLLKTNVGSLSLPYRYIPSLPVVSTILVHTLKPC